ncbi:hypothetical protein ACOSP7_009690 [Xanthoceras sorbifolium]
MYNGDGNYCDMNWDISDEDEKHSDGDVDPPLGVYGYLSDGDGHVEQNTVGVGDLSDNGLSDINEDNFSDDYVMEDNI